MHPFAWTQALDVILNLQLHGLKGFQKYQLLPRYCVVRMRCKWLCTQLSEFPSSASVHWKD